MPDAFTLDEERSEAIKQMVKKENQITKSRAKVNLPLGCLVPLKFNTTKC